MRRIERRRIFFFRSPVGRYFIVVLLRAGRPEDLRRAPDLLGIAIDTEDNVYTLVDTALLAATGPFDLVVCSYGLLHREREALAAVAWQTGVLDEARAIKSPQTRRSQAAMALHSEFRATARRDAGCDA